MSEIGHLERFLGEKQDLEGYFKEEQRRKKMGGNLERDLFSSQTAPADSQPPFPRWF
jgi:hypothetical protein